MGMTEEKRAVLAAASIAIMEAADDVVTARCAVVEALRQRDDVIIAALDAGMTRQEVAAVLGMHQNRIRQIVRGTRT